MAPKPRSKSKPDNPKQSKLFIAKAREIGADEDRSVSDKLMGQLAKTAPEPRAGKQKAKGKTHGA